LWWGVRRLSFRDYYVFVSDLDGVRVGVTREEVVVGSGCSAVILVVWFICLLIVVFSLLLRRIFGMFWRILFCGVLLLFWGRLELEAVMNKLELLRKKLDAVLEPQKTILSIIMGEGTREMSWKL